MDHINWIADCAMWLVINKFFGLIILRKVFNYSLNILSKSFNILSPYYAEYAAFPKVDWMLKQEQKCDKI